MSAHDLSAFARGGPVTTHDLVELAKFERFLKAPATATWLPEWRPYIAGTGNPPPPATPAHGGYPGEVVR